jgi:hypothetical protein
MKKKEVLLKINSAEDSSRESMWEVVQYLLYSLFCSLKPCNYKRDMGHASVCSGLPAGKGMGMLHATCYYARASLA